MWSRLRLHVDHGSAVCEFLLLISSLHMLCKEPFFFLAYSGQSFLFSQVLCFPLSLETKMNILFSLALLFCYFTLWRRTLFLRDKCLLRVFFCPCSLPNLPCVPNYFHSFSVSVSCFKTHIRYLPSSPLINIDQHLVCNSCVP